MIIKMKILSFSLSVLLMATAGCSGKTETNESKALVESQTSEQDEHEVEPNSSISETGDAPSYYDESFCEVESEEYYMLMDEISEQEQLEQERLVRKRIERENAPTGPPSVEGIKVDEDYDAKLADGINGMEFTLSFKALNLAGHRVVATLTIKERDSAYNTEFANCKIIQDTYQLSWNFNSNKETKANGAFRIPYSNFNKISKYRCDLTAPITATDEDGNELTAPEKIDFYIN